MKDGPFLERIGLPRAIQEKRTVDMYHTTGFSKDEIVDLCAVVRAADPESGIDNWPPILGLFKSVVVTLTYLRRNHVQQELAEYFGVSQSTISRAITGLTLIVARMLADHVPVAEDLVRGEQFIIDGTLLPCWSWHAHPELHSGKHKTTGMNVQVACDLYGTLRWVSRDPAKSLVIFSSNKFSLNFCRSGPSRTRP